MTSASCVLFMLPVQAQKLIGTTELKFTDFARPPYPIEIINVSLQPGGGLRFQTGMPISGRIAAKTDAAKMRGALFSPSGTYLYSSIVDASGQLQSSQGMVFSPQKPRVEQPGDTVVEWAVWGTNSDDGPLRLPFGGSYDQLATQSDRATSKVSKLVSLQSAGPGLNYNNYALFPRYHTITRSIDFPSGRIATRIETVDLQEATHRATLQRYISVDGSTPERQGLVIAIANTRFEGIATRFVKDDKNASARQVNFLTFDDAGNLVKDQPVNFTYNRALTARIRIHDTTGKVVGSCNVFGNGPGKKDAQDPEENRFSVVITDEQGGIWSQFEWVTNGSSGRSVIPTYALRKGDQVFLYSTNQQKLLKPVEESWVFDRVGKAVLNNSMSYFDIPKIANEIGTANSAGEGWFNYASASYVDSFADVNGDVWVLLQRRANPPLSSSPAPAPAAAAPAPTSRLMSFTNKMNQLSGQSPTPVSTAASPAISPGRSNDVFVLQLDSNLKLKHLSVVALQVSALHASRFTIPAGMAYLLNDDANTLLTIKNGALAVKRLRPIDGVVMASSEGKHFVADETAGKLYLLFGLSQKPGQGRLITYDLNQN